MSTLTDQITIAERVAFYWWLLTFGVAIGVAVARLLPV